MDIHTPISMGMVLRSAAFGLKGAPLSRANRLERQGTYSPHRKMSKATDETPLKAIVQFAFPNNVIFN